jgi:enoyl-CoA hydratase
MGIALELLYTGEYVTSEDAERWGLINRIVEREQVLPTALALAERIAANAPISVRRMKETAVKGLELPLWQALRLDVGPNPYLSEDRKEGIAAYLEKRRPRWSGR